MKLIAILIMAMLPIMLVAEEVKLPLPKDVEKAVKSHTKDVAKANVELEKAITKANDELIKAIDSAISSSKDIKSYEGFKAALTDEQIVENEGVDIKVRELAALYIKRKEIAGEKEKVSLFGEKKEESWDDLRGIEIKVLATSNGVDIEIPNKNGYQMRIIPNEEDRWTANGGDDTKCSYAGILDKTISGNPKMAVVLKSENEITKVDPKSTIKPGLYKIACNDDTLQNNTGYIRVKIIMEKE